ncbi:hypothetical protein BR93DRAFT_386470 [Coniochaeta sp. PMI_546]|nr:hypothetical protein BR93DRAFT_386470 [Coniochaeta sp. PMI_546]
MYATFPLSIWWSGPLRARQAHSDDIRKIRGHRETTLTSLTARIFVSIQGPVANRVANIPVSTVSQAGILKGDVMGIGHGRVGKLGRLNQSPTFLVLDHSACQVELSGLLNKV